MGMKLDKAKNVLDLLATIAIITGTLINAIGKSKSSK
jgi:hypothetical protein